MTISILAVIAATVVQFIIGAIWYTPVFGKLWGKIHGHDQLTPVAQKEAMKHMAPLLGAQFAVTLVTSFVFALLVQGFPSEWNIYGLAFFFWLGFVVPTQVSAILFGGTDPKWIWPKLGIMAGGSLICLLAAAGVISLF